MIGLERDFYVRSVKRGPGRKAFEIVERATGAVRATRASETPAMALRDRMQAELDRYRAALTRPV